MTQNEVVRVLEEESMKLLHVLCEDRPESVFVTQDNLEHVDHLETEEGRKWLIVKYAIFSPVIVRLIFFFGKIQVQLLRHPYSKEMICTKEKCVEQVLSKKEEREYLKKHPIDMKEQKRLCETIRKTINQEIFALDAMRVESQWLLLRWNSLPLLGRVNLSSHLEEYLMRILK